MASGNIASCVFLIFSSVALAQPPARLMSASARSSVQATAISSAAASKVLDLVAKRYSTCKSYRDTGVVETHFRTGPRTFTTRRPFQTAFIRPDKFRFAYSDGQGVGSNDVYIVHQEGTTTKTWWHVEGGEEAPASLGLAIAGATGVSGGSAHTIPALLLPDVVPGWRLTDLVKLERLPDISQAGTRLMQIKGEHARGGIHIVTIDEASLLIKKIEEPDAKVTRTATYAGEFGVDIPERELTFSAPPLSLGQ